MQKKFRAWQGNFFIYADLLDVNARANDLGNRNSHIWEQFIGYRDVNGKEIYEGDIVEDEMSDGENRIGIITMDPKEWGAEPFIAKGKIPSFEYKGFIELLERSRIKITGNIHENPEFFYAYFFES